MIYEFLIISTLVFFQSIFGIGLLLFGTPTFLLLNYNFLDTLNILLPISITISFLQLFLSKNKNPKFIKDFNLFTLPFLGISLYLIINFLDSINLEIFIALIIIFFSLINSNRKKVNFLKNLTSFKQNFLLSLIGVIHGLTNLGGSLLTILSSVINKDDKSKTRYCIAYGYLIMGIIQLLVLFFFSNHHIKLNNLGYVLLVFVIYFPSQKIFHSFKGERFTRYLNIFALFYGILILVKHL
jgi:hypothetical protein